MDETMNTGVEVATGVSGAEEVTQEITIEETSSGPSKGFIALVVGGIAAVGATVAIKRHKKKKAAQAEEEFFEDDFDEDLEDEEDNWVETEEDQKEEAESKIERIR